MPKIGRRLFPGLFRGLFLGSLAAAACGALMVGSCSSESLNGTGTGGKTGGQTGGVTGMGASTSGFGGTTGGGGSIGSGGAAMGGIGGDGIGAGGDIGGAGGDCEVIIDEPPILTVVDSQTGASICAPTFDIVAVSPGGIIPDASGNPYPCNGMAVFGCPTPPSTTGATAVCQFALEAIGDMPPTSQYTVEVSAPGYWPSTAYDVVAGQGGCSVSSPATQITIDLLPNPGSVDGGPQIDASDSPLHL